MRLSNLPNRLIFEYACFQGRDCRLSFYPGRLLQEAKEKGTTSEEPMIEGELILNNRLGLHARPAAKFVKLTDRFNSDIHLEKDGERVNGKSILEIMTLALEQGASVKIIIKGEDEQDAFRVVEEFFLQNE